MLRPRARPAAMTPTSRRHLRRGQISADTRQEITRPRQPPRVRLYARVPVRGLRRGPAHLQQARRLFQIQGPAGPAASARSVVRLRAQSQRKAAAGVMRGQFDRGQAIGDEQRRALVVFIEEKIQAIVQTGHQDAAGLEHTRKHSCHSGQTSSI